MQKALTTLTLFLVCIAAASVAYYFVKYLPRVHDAELAERRRKTDLENVQRCNRDATVFYADFRKSVSSALPASRLNWADSEMHFSHKLNTCLVETGSDEIVGGGLLYHKSVMDVYSNRQVIGVDYTFTDGKERLLLSSSGIDGSKKYFAEKDKLFSE